MKIPSYNGKKTLALACLACTALLGLLPLAASGAELAASPRKARLRLLFANSLVQDINRDDARSAFKLWVETVGRNHGLLLEAETDSYDRLEEVEKRLREKTLDLVIFTTMDYLQLGEDGPLQPVFSPIRSQEALFDVYVLLTRRDRNLTTLSALRGRSVAFRQHGANLGRLWLEVTLGESSFGSVNDFFGTKSDVTKPSSVVLPVFFGKFDAGVVNRSILETMCEMNPQLGTQLQVLTNSAALSEGVICLHRDYAEARADVLAGLADLHTDPRGQQLLLMFKMSKLLPFKPEYLDGVRDLKAREIKLGTPSQGKAALTAAGGEPKL